MTVPGGMPTQPPQPPAIQGLPLPQRPKKSPWDSSSVGGAPPPREPPRAGSIARGASSPAWPGDASPAGLRRQDSDVTEHAIGDALPDVSMNELAAWLESRIPTASDSGSTHTSEPGAPQGATARAGAVPVLESPPLIPTARAQVAADHSGPPETLRLPPEPTVDDPQGRPPGPPSVSDLSIAPPTLAPDADQRLSNPNVRGLHATRAHADQAQATGTGSETMSAPGELAGLLNDLQEADPGLSPDRSSGRASPGRAPSLRSVQDTVPETTGQMMAPAARKQTAAARGSTKASKPRAATAARAVNEVRFDAAPLWRRLTATFIDAAAVIGLLYLPLRAGWFGPVVSAIRPWEPDDIGRALFGGHLTFPLILAALTVLLLSIVPHALAGRSLGKLLTGLMLVSNWTGERPGWVQVVVRQVMGLFTTALGAASYLWFIVDRRSSTLHDRLTGTTCVIAGSRVVQAAHDPVS